MTDRDRANESSPEPTTATSPGLATVGAQAGEPAPKPARRFLARVKPYLALARPDHWFKNVFMAVGVLLAAFYHPEWLGAGAVLAIMWALAATCLIASSNYVLNEILDAPTDRSHPTKRYRPIPSGKVAVPIAYALWAGLGLAGLALALGLGLAFFAAGLFLLGMGLIYNVPPIRSKELPYVDVLTESINNPIRLLLGWFAVSAAEFPPVSLLLAYWMIGAFFMASKRLAEYRGLGDPETAAAYRRSFRHYDQEKLLISMFFYTTCFALFLGVFIIRYHLELILVFPLVAGFICYYLQVTFKKDSAAQNPERLYREKGLMAYLLVCVAAFVGLMFVRIPALYELFHVQQSSVDPLWKF